MYLDWRWGHRRLDSALGEALGVAALSDHHSVWNGRGGAGDTLGLTLGEHAG